MVLTLILVRPISGRVSEIDGLMLLTVGVVWVAPASGELILDLSLISAPSQQRF